MWSPPQRDGDGFGDGAVLGCSAVVLHLGALPPAPMSVCPWFRKAFGSSSCRGFCQGEFLEVGLFGAI